MTFGDLLERRKVARSPQRAYSRTSLSGSSREQTPSSAVMLACFSRDMTDVWLRNASLLTRTHTQQNIHPRLHANLKGSRTLRPQDISAPILSQITGGAVSCRSCPGSKVSRLFVDLMPKCLVPRFLVQMCLETVMKCLMRVSCGSEVSWCRSVLWPKCPVTNLKYEYSMSQKLAPSVSSLFHDYNKLTR